MELGRDSSTHVGSSIKLSVHERGFWVGKVNPLHRPDPFLAAYLAATVFKPKDTILELGCGSGYMVKFLQTRGFSVNGCDGNPNTPEMTGGKCFVADLADPQELGEYDWVISLEIGEHIPEKFADIFLDNVANHARKGVIISWALPGQEGIGHVNCRDNQYVIDKMANRGFVPVFNWGELRKHTLLPWFSRTLMAYERQTETVVRYPVVQSES